VTLSTFLTQDTQISIRQSHQQPSIGILWKIKAIMQHVLQVQQISLLPDHIKSITNRDFLRVFAFVNAGLEKVNTQLQNHLAVT
jgi:hypothetical protein